MKFEKYTVFAKEKYTQTQNVYDNLVQIHTTLGLTERVPEYWQGKTIDAFC